MPETDGTSALKSSERFTLEQWRSWPEGERWELIGGVAYAMSPAPRVPHQKIVLNLARAIGGFLDGKPCQPFIAPVDVFLPSVVDDSPDTVVQPDVMVVCDPDKVHEDGIHGAPDFVAEVLSESTAYKDLTAKKNLYEKSGVREYWIINPDSHSVLGHTLENGLFLPATETVRGMSARSSALPGFEWTLD